MTAQTTTQRTAAHRRRMAEKMARYEGALREIERLGKTNPLDFIATAAEIASTALNPTDPAKS